ncbi:MAG TPA: hypothetical protein VFM30_05180 [Steroidobacteraceae bacterium]|jgi:hypothetical protein|nr:hypothetical protein [Steroidobacteraceae bacterium]
MRITDDRYTRDRLRLDLALRLIRHEARTRTIRSWTGLTDDRIRKLYRSYVAEGSRRGVRRHRGKSPRQSAFFMRNAAIRREAAGLATLLCMLGLLRRDGTPTPGAVESLRWGERFCEAYETFLSLHEQPQISFEHACHLLRALEKQNEICLEDCGGCGSLLVVMRYAERPDACEFCAASRPPARPGLAVGDC